MILSVFLFKTKVALSRLDRNHCFPFVWTFPLPPFLVFFLFGHLFFFFYPANPFRFRFLGLFTFFLLSLLFIDASGVEGLKPSREEAEEEEEYGENASTTWAKENKRILRHSGGAGNK